MIPLGCNSSHAVMQSFYWTIVALFLNTNVMTHHLRNCSSNWHLLRSIFCVHVKTKFLSRRLCSLPCEDGLFCYAILRRNKLSWYFSVMTQRYAEVENGTVVICKLSSLMGFCCLLRWSIVSWSAKFVGKSLLCNT